MSSKPNTSTSVTRALRIIKALKGYTNFGLSNKEISEATGESAVNVSRMLNVLVEEGFVDRVYDNGGGGHSKYAHSIQLLQIAQACINEDERLSARLEEKRRRIRAGSHN
ncbi:IclR helix-turn-helix domain [Yersinia aldovae]|uniref:helix-turn-helix domain-containing protein n=1 Tax=Yersinia aldovae TaxID=29483 RepID=UPI0005E92A50|nr:helix-turn-helix domain-containing protein [Yersinia aldovae]CNJ03831.1 IclR helix-turn-helix domain [Yersinia aldovae]